MYLGEVMEENLSLMHPNPFVELKIVDATGNVVPRGTAGDIHVRSPFTMVGYLDDPHHTEQAITTAKWYVTGDIGVMTENGKSFEIVGRTKDVISKGGSKVYPRGIEDLLLQHPRVSKACVIGVPDPKLFNEICACITLTPGEKLTEDELVGFCTQKTMGNVSLMVPKYYYFTESFPLNTSGKVDKKVLIKITTEHFHL